MIGAGFLSLSAAFFVAGFGFVGARFAVARWSGVRGWHPIFAVDQKPWGSIAFGRRVLFALAGPTGVYLTTALVIALGYVLAGSTAIDETSMRVNVRPSSPAEEAGIQNGDRIVSVDSVGTPDWATLRAATAKHAGERVDVVVERGGQNVTISATPNEAGKLGLTPPAQQTSVGPGEALWQGLTTPAVVVGNAVKGVFRLILGRERPEISGPVAIVQTTGQAHEAGFGRVLLLLGNLMSYFLLIPLVIVSLVFFPRARSTA